MIPKHVDEQMWKTLDEVSDECGELELDGYILRYEGWSPRRSPSIDSEHQMSDHAIAQAPRIHREWNAMMQRRGYKAVMLGHNEHLGLYGVTYALYERRLK